VCCVFGVFNISVLGFLLSRMGNLLFTPPKRVRKHQEASAQQEVVDILDRFLTEHSLVCSGEEVRLLARELVDR
jgi:hypothetical protein